MTKKQQLTATWVFGVLFFGVLCLVLFTGLVKTDDPVKGEVVYLFCSLMGGIFAGFFTGQMTVNTDWGSGKKAGISAAGGFAVFVVIWLGLQHASGKNTPPNTTTNHARLSMLLTRVELDRPSGEWHSTSIPSDNMSLLADSKTNQLAQWISESIHAEAKDDKDETPLAVSYVPGIFETKTITNHTTHTETRVVSVPVKVRTPFGPGIVVHQPKTENITVPETKINVFKELIPNKVLTVTPDADPLKRYIFTLDSNGNIIRKLPESDTTEDLLPANGSIMLLLARPGYRMDLTLINLAAPLDKKLTLKKRPLIISMDTEGVPASNSDHLKDLLTQQQHFKVFDKTQLLGTANVLNTKSPFKTQTDVRNLENDLEQTAIDYMLTVRLDQMPK